MPKKRVTHSASYEPPVTPASWGADARMFAQRVKRLFDELFAQQSKTARSVGELVDANSGLSKQVGDLEGQLENMDDSVKLMPDSIFRAVVDSIYKVGDLFETTVAENDPNKKWTWQKWEPYMPGRVLIGAGVSDYGVTHTAGQIGGEASHTLTENEMPSHTHSVKYMSWGGKGLDTTISNSYNFWVYDEKNQSNPGSGYIGTTGGSQPHNNMQPYAVVYRWIRVE